MKLHDLVYTGLALLALVAVSATVGYDIGAERSSARAAKEISEAHVSAALSDAQAPAVSGALQDVDQRLQRAKALLQAQEAETAVALLNNTKLQADIVRLTKQQTEDILKVGHEDPDCTDLARLPVCPAVAQRLWPEESAGQDPERR